MYVRKRVRAVQRANGAILKDNRGIPSGSAV